VAARIVILAGERGVGKTTVCRETIALARARGYTCGGIITLSCPNDVNDVNDIRDVLDVYSGRVRRLTVESNPPDTPASNSVVVQGRFRFDPETLAWGNDVLTHAPACHLFVVDEVGPLEIERGQGWVKVFDVLRENDFTLALVVVRTELLEQAQLKLPAGATDVLPVTSHNRDGLPGVLMEMLEIKGGGSGAGSLSQDVDGAGRCPNGATSRWG
jgi:nucleoside-triphosphatase THEP1